MDIIKLGNRVTRGLAAMYFERLIRKNFGFNTNISIDRLLVTTPGEDAELELSFKVRANRKDLQALLQKALQE